MHAFAHKRLIVLICSDDQTSASVRSFADDLLARMVEDSKIFRLRLDGTAALSKALVTELTAKLGQPQSVEMKGSNAEQYGDHAFLTTKAPIGWQWPKKLHFRAYGLDMEVRLSSAPESPNASPRLMPGREASRDSQGPSDDKRHSSADGRAGGAGWRVVKTKSRVAKAELCRDFMRGVCSRGDEFCIFRHSKAPNSHVSEGTGNGRGADSAPTSTRCRDFGRGQCHRGICKFAHGADRNNNSGNSSDNSSDNGNNSDIPVPHARASAAASPEHAPGASVPSSRDSTPRRRRRAASDEDEGESDAKPDSPASDLTSSPCSSRARSRSGSADRGPTPSSPRSYWLRGPPTSLNSAEPKSVLGRKRPLAQASTPPAATPLPAAREPQQQHAAPSEGADLRAP